MTTEQHDLSNPYPNGLRSGGHPNARYFQDAIELRDQLTRFLRDDLTGCLLAKVGITVTDLIPHVRRTGDDDLVIIPAEWTERVEKMLAEQHAPIANVRKV